nr:MAG TPA: hypothetical protein [Caudoviricetes sp.]
MFAVSIPHFTPKYPSYRGGKFTFTIIGLRA